MATYTFDPANEEIIVDSPDTSADIRELWTAIQEFMDEPLYTSIPDFATIAGDAFLFSNPQQESRVGLTLTLYQWKLKFAVASGELFISGGNLVGDSGTLDAPAGDGENPITGAVSTVTIAQASSASIENLLAVLTLAQFLSLKDS
jgi:hypothetical protein